MADDERNPSEASKKATEKIKSKRTISPNDLTVADNPGATISNCKQSDREDYHVEQLLYGLDKRKICNIKEEKDMQHQRRPEERGDVMAMAVNTKIKNAVQPTQRNIVFPFITDGDKAAVSGLSNEQWQSVLRVLNATRVSTSETLSGMDCYASSSQSKSVWILDTGASHHMTSNMSLLTHVRSIAPVNVILADGTERLAVREGTVHLGKNLVLKSVFFVEELMTDLISVSQLIDENDCVLQLANRFLIIQDRITKTVIGLGRRDNGTFYFQGMDVAQALVTKTDSDSKLWHYRFGHPSAKVLSHVSDVDFSLNRTCETCIRAKQTRESFPLSLNKADDIFELIHCDVWGPYRTPSFSGARFFLTIVDDHSRSVWIFLMRNKSETQIKLTDFLSLVRRQFGKEVKTIRSDNGTEFMCMTSYFQKQGILHETSCVGTPNQNGRVERKHRHILNVARALRFQSSLPISFWGECVLTAGYLINRTPSALLAGKSPYEILHNKPPLLSHLRVFGCLCYAHNQQTCGDKFASRTRKCVFVGYPYGQKGWRLYDVELKTFFVSRDVKFCETEFFFQNATGTDVADNIREEEFQLESQINNNDIKGPGSPLHPVDHYHLLEEDQNASSSLTPSSPPVPIEETRNEIAEVQPPTPPVEPQIAQPVAPPVEPSVVPRPSVLTGESIPLRTSTRTRTTSVRLRDYVTNSARIQAAESSPGSSLYPISDFVTDFRFSASHRAFQAAITSASEPQSYPEASKNKNWRDAMRAEIDAQELNHTWDITDLPQGKKAIGCKWVYRFKFKSDGTLLRHKARLVALGNKQKAGEDYDETFAPVAKMGTVRLFLKYAAANNWPVHQMDVHNAFLHGDLKEEIYMKLPPGFNTANKDKVCRLRKSIYGLKQSPRCWFSKLTTALKDYGFIQSFSDYSLFVFNTPTVQLRILIYVDDLIITGNSEAEVRKFKVHLSNNFHMKDLGLLKYFLGLEVARNKTGFYLCQRKYALDIIAECGLLGAKPSATPLPPNHGLALSESPLLQDPSSYRRLIGKLIYLGNTRPDLAYSVHTLAQFMQSPNEAQWDAALRVVRYLKHSPGQGLLLHANAPLSLTGWCDSDWASCPITRKSVTGYVVQLGESTISWKTKKQPTVSRSSAEAEYRAMAMLTQELIWLKRLLLDMGFDHTLPMTICCDSKSAIDIAKNPVFHERTKHVGVDCHFIRDEVISGNIQLEFVPTAEQMADLLTKPLGNQALSMHHSKLGIVDHHAPACGRVKE